MDEDDKDEDFEQTEISYREEENTPIKTGSKRIREKRNLLKLAEREKQLRMWALEIRNLKILSQVHLIVNIVRKYSQGKIILFVMWEINIKNNFALDWLGIF